MKECKVCKLKKSYSEFYRSKTMHDGLNGKCKVCYLKMTAKWRRTKPSYMKNYSLNHRKTTKQIYGVSVKTIERLGLKTVLFVYDRAKRKCEQCGTEFDLTIHHKDRNGRNKLDLHLQQNNSYDNLIVLCRSCHGSIHSKQRWSEYKLKQDAERKNMD